MWKSRIYTRFRSGLDYQCLSALFRLFPSASLLVAHLGLNPVRVRVRVRARVRVRVRGLD